MKVLVVEDRPALRALLVDLLVAEGISADQAADGHSALLRLQNADECWDVVMLDWFLADATGETLLPAILASSPGIRCLVVSGHSALDLDALYRPDRRVAYLEKPFTPPMLLQGLRDLMQKDSHLQ